MHLIKKMLAQIDASPTSSNFKPNILDAIRMISAAWEEVKPETIKNCFQKAGWKKADNAIMQNKDENNMNTIPLSVLREQIHLPETMTFEDYVYVDNELHAHEELTEEDILASLQCTETPFEEDEEEDEDEHDGNCFIKNRDSATTDAKHYLTELRRFFESRAFMSDVEFSSIAKLKSSLLKHVNNNQAFSSDCLYFIAIYYCPNYDF